MFDIHVILQNSPGTLSRLTTLLGRHGIGLEGGGLFSFGEQSHAHFLVEEGERARAVLEAEGIAVEAVNVPLIRRLPQQRPGELGRSLHALPMPESTSWCNTAITLTS